MRCLFGTDDGVFAVDTATGDVAHRGLAGASIRCLHRSADGRLWAGTGRPRAGAPTVDGFFVADDEGTFRPVELPDGGQVWSMVHLPDDGSMLLAGTLPPRLLRSEDGGATWEELERFQQVSNRDTWTFFDGPATAHVRSLATSVADRGVVAAAIEIGGISVSLDRGVTWKDRTGPLDRDCHAVHLSPAAPGRLLASCQRGIFASDDLGATWNDTPLAEGYFVPLVSALDGVVVYSTSASDDGVVYRSDDGAPFRAVGHGLPRPAHGAATLVVAPLDPECVAYAGSTDDGGAVYVTTDGGAAWERVAELPSTPRRALLADLPF